MNIKKYTEPVSSLLTYGDARNLRDWSEYMALGFNQEHIQELIKVIQDEDLDNRNAEGAEVWAQVHAWRTLGKLQAIEAIPALVGMLYQIDEYDDDFIAEEFPDVFALIGIAAIPALSEYLLNKDNSLYARVCAAHSICQIALIEDQARSECVARLEASLKPYRDNDGSMNGLIISYLIDLKAVESIDVIRSAYNDECVDLHVCGDCEDVEIELGIRENRSTPRPQFYNPFQSLDLDDDEDDYDYREASSAPTTYFRDSKKIGRNDPCPCGSGKKYKKCCLN